MSLIVPILPELEALRSRSSRIEMAVDFPLPLSLFWPSLANTDLMNEALGLPLPEFTWHVLPQGSPHLMAQVKSMGMQQIYHEFPYEWEQERYLHVERIFDKGFFRYLKYGLHCEQDPARNVCHVTFYFDFVSKMPGFMAETILKLNLQHIVSIFTTAAQKQGDSQSDWPVVAFMQTENPPVNAIAKLGDHWHVLMPDSPIPAQVAAYLYTVPERYSHHLRPREIAAQTQLPEREVLKFCLLATQGGWLIHRWALLCTSCWGAKHVADSLQAIQKSYYCESCGCEYESQLDQNMELVFSPAPQWRVTQDRSFCAGSPANSPQIVKQHLVWKGKSQFLALDLPEGTYRLWRDQQAKLLHLDLDAPRAETAGWEQQEEEAMLHLRPGSVLEIKHSYPSPLRLRLEDLSYVQPVITAAELFRLPEFLALFGDERPGPDQVFQARQQLFLRAELPIHPAQESLEAALQAVAGQYQGARIRARDLEAPLFGFGGFADLLQAGAEMLKTCFTWEKEHPGSTALVLLAFESPCSLLSQADLACFQLPPLALPTEQDVAEPTLMLQEKLSRNPYFPQFLELSENTLALQSSLRSESGESWKQLTLLPWLNS